MMKNLLMYMGLGLVLAGSPALAQYSGGISASGSADRGQSTVERSVPATSAQPSGATAMPKRYLASSLIGHDVKNTQGDTVGEVEDLILADDGRLDGVVISVGEFLGMGGKRIALDPKHLSPQDDGLIISMSRDQLNAAPDFSQRPVIIR